MTAEHQPTQEEEAFWRLLDEAWETLTGAGRTIIRESESVAYAEYMVRSYCVQPEEYEEATEKTRLSAGELTDRDCELLKETVRAAIATLGSIDPFDRETLVGYKVHRDDLHRYYRMVSDMVMATLMHREVLIYRKEAAKENSESFEDFPF